MIGEQFREVSLPEHRPDHSKDLVLIRKPDLLSLNPVTNQRLQRIPLLQLTGRFQIPQDTSRDFYIADAFLLQNGQQVFEFVLISAVQGVEEFPNPRLFSGLPKGTFFVNDQIEPFFHLFVHYFVKQQRKPLELDLLSGLR